ncbi:CsbD family protein [Streptomyces sp. NPDC057445]|uniref:CsbD family protein n=1 Tax=Streptomyces sp. NPDC057445 TaxID=3346136 RepID=UPI0036C03DB5
MSKGKAKAKQAKGKMKETLGKATGDRSMEHKGQGEMLGGKAQEMSEKAADKARRATGH